MTSLNRQKVGLISVFFWVLISIWVIPCRSDQKTKLQIGVIVAQSGKAQDYGHAAVQGARLAADEINARGGVRNHQIELVVLDNKSTAINSREAANKAVFRNVTGVVGAVWSTHSIAVAQVLQVHRIPMISPGSTAPEVTLTGDYIFRTCYTDKFQGKLMADFAFHSTQYRQAAVLTNISQTYSKTLASYFSQNFKANGGQIVYEGGYKGSAVDYKDILLPLIPLKPEIIFVPGYSQDSGLIIKQARKLGIDAVFMGGDAWETAVADYAGSALTGSYFSTFWHPNVPYPRNKQFVSSYRSAHGKGEISSYAPLAYDAVWLFADAVRRSRDLDPKKIRAALAATRNFQGATGNYSFNAYGDPVNKGASILKFQEDHWVFFKAYEPKSALGSND